jgi:polysaccharide deacetylase family protein (PEP-CTERM system associated)
VGQALSAAAPLVVSFDVEDWPQSTWDRSLPISDRSRANAEKLLDILAVHDRKATLFILGKFAERFPDLIRRMHAAGHEIASHGHGHVEIFTQSPAVFREDVSRSKKLLEDIIGEEVIGYRAPDFSIIRESLWALETLAELGFRYDSSIYPIRHKRYGIEDWPVDPVNVKLPSGATIVELPIATVSLFGRALPVGGGGYHRLLPWMIIDWAVRRLTTNGRPFVAYGHPYEFDAHEFASLPFRIPLKTRLHQGLGRARLEQRFKAMIGKYESTRARDLALSREWPAIAPAA